MLPVDLFAAEDFLENPIVSMKLKFAAGALVQEPPYQTVVHANGNRMGVQNDDILENLWKVPLRCHRQAQSETHGPQVDRVGKAETRQVKHSHNATVGVGPGVDDARKVGNQEHGMLYDVVVCDAVLPKCSERLVERAHIVDEDARVLVLGMAGADEPVAVELLDETEFLVRQRIRRRRSFGSIGGLAYGERCVVSGASCVDANPPTR